MYLYLVFVKNVIEINSIFWETLKADPTIITIHYSNIDDNYCFNPQLIRGILQILLFTNITKHKFITKFAS